jgi:hypothetical protein
MSRCLCQTTHCISTEGLSCPRPSLCLWWYTKSPCCLNYVPRSKKSFTSDLDFQLSDLILIAPTGSGKTLLFWMPLLFNNGRITVVMSVVVTSAHCWTCLQLAGWCRKTFNRSSQSQIVAWIKLWWESCRLSIRSWIKSGSVKLTSRSERKTWLTVALAVAMINVGSILLHHMCLAQAPRHKFASCPAVLSCLKVLVQVILHNMGVSGSIAKLSSCALTTHMQQEKHSQRLGRSLVHAA